MMNVEPIVTPLVTVSSFGLRDLISVMRESVIDTAAVNIYMTNMEKLLVVKNSD